MSNANAVVAMRDKDKPSSSASHVLQAISAVTATIAKDGIGKSRKNEQQGYKFRGIDEVLNALATVIAENDLVIVPHIRSREITERQTTKGGVLFTVVVTADYTFVSARDGSDYTVGPFYGEAMDSGDKATNKAMSAAYKYMAIQTFCIPTEGDNDADATTHEVAPAPPRVNASQAKKADLWGVFTARLESMKDLDALESWWADANTQAKIDQMPAAWQEQAAEAYEKRQEALLSAGRP